MIDMIGVPVAPDVLVPDGVAVLRRGTLLLSPGNVHKLHQMESEQLLRFVQGLKLVNLDGPKGIENCARLLPMQP